MACQRIISIKNSKIGVLSVFIENILHQNKTPNIWVDINWCKREREGDLLNEKEKVCVLRNINLKHYA